MILVIVVIVRVGVQELHTPNIRCQTRKQLRGVGAIVRCPHHLRGARLQLELTAKGYVDLRSHTPATLCSNEDNTVSTLGTIDSSTVAQHLHPVNIIHVHVGEYVIEIAVMNHRAVILHIHHHTVDNHQRLGIACQGVDAIDKHHATTARHPTAVHRPHAAVHALLYERFDTHLCIIVETACCCHSTPRGAHKGAEHIAVQPRIHVPQVIANSHLLRKRALHMHIETTNMVWNTDKILTIPVCDGSIHAVPVCLYTNALQWRTSSSICHPSFYVLGKGGRGTEKGEEQKKDPFLPYGHPSP